MDMWWCKDMSTQTYLHGTWEVGINWSHLGVGSRVEIVIVEERGITAR